MVSPAHALLYSSATPRIPFAILTKTFVEKFLRFQRTFFKKFFGGSLGQRPKPPEAQMRGFAPAPHDLLKKVDQNFYTVGYICGWHTASPMITFSKGCLARETPLRASPIGSRRKEGGFPLPPWKTSNPLEVMFRLLGGGLFKDAWVWRWCAVVWKQLREWLLQKFFREKFLGECGVMGCRVETVVLVGELSNPF